MKLKYIGNKKDFVFTGEKGKLDFSKGTAEVPAIEAKALLAKCPRSFVSVEAPKKDDK